MRNRYFILLVLPVLILLSCNKMQDQFPAGSVNPIIGNESFSYYFGKNPDAESDEFTRVQSHLRYAEMLLRNRDTSQLTDEQKQMRFHLLDLLREYWQNGVFPRNEKYPDERRPCFIDDDGRICAVGYLVEQTAGRQMAERINERYQYATIGEMKLPELDAWIAAGGLTREEVATIQPTYGTYVFRANHIGIGAGISARSFNAGYPALDLSFQHSGGKFGYSAMARYESLGIKDYITGLRLALVKSVINLPLSIGVTPSIFNDNNSKGSNLKPDLAVSFPSKPLWRFNLQFMMSYGYDFALSNADAFPVPRHDLSVRAFLQFQLKTKPKLEW